MPCSINGLLIALNHICGLRNYGSLNNLIHNKCLNLPRQKQTTIRFILIYEFYQNKSERQPDCDDLESKDGDLQP